MIGTVQSSVLFAFKESVLKALNRPGPQDALGSATGTQRFGFAAPGASEAQNVGIFGAYTVTPHQLGFGDGHTYTWELDPAGQELYGLSVSSAGVVSGDLTNGILEDAYMDITNHTKPNPRDLPPNGNLAGFSGGFWVINLRVRASGAGPNAGYWEFLEFIIPTVEISGSITLPAEYADSFSYQAYHLPDAVNTAEGIGFGPAPDPYVIASSGYMNAAILEHISGSGWRLKIIANGSGIGDLVFTSGFSASPFGVFNVTGSSGGSGTFTIS